MARADLVVIYDDQWEPMAMIYDGCRAAVRLRPMGLFGSSWRRSTAEDRSLFRAGWSWGSQNFARGQSEPHPWRWIARRRPRRLRGDLEGPVSGMRRREAARRIQDIWSLRSEEENLLQGVGADARPNLAWRYTVLLQRTARAIAESRDRLDDGDGLSDSGKKRLLDRVDRLEREQQIRRRELAAIGCSDILEQHDAAEQRRTRARLPRQGRR